MARREVEVIRLNRADIGVLIGLAAAIEPDECPDLTGRAMILRCKAAFLASQVAEDAGHDPYVWVAP
jgi:hypothetical protein